METKQNILHSELKNLYALEKQSEEVMTTVLKGVKNKKVQKFLKKWQKADRQDYKAVKRLLEKNKINPGSTVDSVASEILKNIQEIASQTDTTKEAKAIGLYASLNRLVHYKIACYEASHKMAKAMGDSKLEKTLKKSSKNLNKVAKRLDKYAKKYFLPAQ
ncbi:DUF892 family protein [Flavobacteriaceae bacterium Ap0902]|nr:DUF892 family protein [Flavobacteriaceae bacterium Ap0902]